jgi:hypothetical protein
MLLLDATDLNCPPLLFEGMSLRDPSSQQLNVKCQSRDLWFDEYGRRRYGDQHVSVLHTDDQALMSHTTVSCHTHAGALANSSETKLSKLFFNVKRDLAQLVALSWCHYLSHCCLDNAQILREEALSKDSSVIFQSHSVGDECGTPSGTIFPELIEPMP